MSVFGLIIAGRMVQTDFTALKEMEYMIEIQDAESINHLVIFLTGLSPLPVNYGGSIYMSWTPIGGERQWNYLGFISNEKPSALFKIGQLTKHTQQQNPQNFSFNASNINTTIFNNSAVHSALIGVKVEPMIEILRRNENEETSTSEQLSSLALFPEKMLRNFVNFMHSFAVSFPKPNTTQYEEYVPAKSVTECVKYRQQILLIFGKKRL
uniref:Hikeshi-like domain-containing protein n=1 Tax=Meloidogyne javanica TaxID=6303 RepID=A0A915N845_MELJA